jgi:hypothetical protein
MYVCNTNEMLAIKARVLGRRELEGSRAQGKIHGTRKV